MRLSNAKLAVIAQRAASSLETLQTSYDLAQLVVKNDIHGDIVECGVYHGAQIAAMALGIKDAYGRYTFQRKVIGFDCFEGIPAPSEHDKQWIEAGHPVGTSCATLEQVYANLKEWSIPIEAFELCSGYFEEAVPKWASRRLPETISVLRLDGDLYESTKVCIEHLYPLVSKGGFIIVDDFGLDGARKAVEEYILGKGGPGWCPIVWQKS
ncbi:MAG: TylF/MycF/NovP-related O-methyltransferase [Terriglobales bacterium]